MVLWWVLIHCGNFLPVFLGNQLELWNLWETLKWILFYSYKIYWNLELGFFDFEISQKAKTRGNDKIKKLPNASHN